MSGSDEPLSPFRANEDPQAYVLASSLNYVWDVGTLEWTKDTGGGAGPSAVTIADGADVAEGSVSDAAWVAGDGTVIALLKTIATSGGATTIADGSDVAEGATTDAAVVTDVAGTVSGKLRGLVKWAFERMPASLGQKAMANSLPVVIASDQSAVPVSGTVSTGGLTDSELRATPVPVSGTVAVTNAALSVVGGGAEATALRVTVASDSTGLLSVDDNGASLTVDAPVGTPVFVRLSDGAAPIATLPVSAASLPLPTGASTAALQTQPGVDIGDVTVNNAAGASAVNIQDGGNTITVDGTVAATQSGTWTIFANGTGYVIRLEEASATITYVGQAVPTTATSAAAWSIKRLDSASGLVVLWGGGTAAFNQIWDDRAGLAYS